VFLLSKSKENISSHVVTSKTNDGNEHAQVSVSIQMRKLSILFITSELPKFRFNNLPILAKSLQLHNLLVSYARELFKPIKDSAGLLVCNEKERFWVICG